MDPVEDARRIRLTASQLRSEEEVQARIADLAEEIGARIGHDNPLVIVVMTGGMFFATELCRHLDFPYELDYLHVWRYGNELEGGALEWIMRPRSDLTGRTVLLIDDVLDRGVTIREVKQDLLEQGPASLLIAVLASKDAKVSQRPAIDFVGFVCPDRYLFGCGMDYKGFWRGLPALYAIDE